ncbi:MAG TPA: NAD(P)/FAD-dependent oxidoreductase [Chryseolinea sp.]|nr:NAD(P)/FAD-dependent oxidoreductase [Chryseolinea sp.]HPH45799.1 NAD(P)/FAD-dependent oxidoreductase [Chryseolinea sp.]HPM28869.1 NAD(P)/FAD-dependent oxidoreductase [Chryseolinea sp.]
MQFDLVVIGGGASGFFGAIQAAEKKPGLNILILEKSSKLLSKVRISGGGRCNVTHHCFEPIALAHHYPRGEKPLKSLFQIFQAKETVAWFASKGVQLKTEEDGRMFPVTDNSETIIDCFLEQARQLKIKIETSKGVVSIQQENDQFKIICQHGEIIEARKILIAAGGHPNKQGYEWMSNLDHNIVDPLPSLFTFNDSEKKFKDLMGVAVPAAEVRIAGSKFSQTGPVLITHWGLSGPAVIKLSAWAATYLYEKKYEFTALVSWIGAVKEETLRDQLAEQKSKRGKQKVISNPLFSLPQRLWIRICELSEVEETKIWAELPQKNINKLIEFMIRCPFQIKGKTTFKEEFVTCGGIDVSEIHLATMESKKVKNIFFAGEVLNIDGETGGFNFQAAWTTAFIAAKGIVG